MPKLSRINPNHIEVIRMNRTHGIGRREFGAWSMDYSGLFGR